VNGEWIHSQKFLARLGLQLPNIDKVPRDTCRSRHGGRYQMRTPPRTLTALKIAIARGGAALTGFEPVGIHGQTHRAAGLTPFKTRITKDLV
jgi:hypothetical protein